MWTDTGQIPRLIGVFAGCTGDFVGYFVLRLTYSENRKCFPL